MSKTRKAPKAASTRKVKRTMNVNVDLRRSTRKRTPSVRYANTVVIKKPKRAKANMAGLSKMLASVQFPGAREVIHPIQPVTTTYSGPLFAQPRFLAPQVAQASAAQAVHAASQAVQAAEAVQAVQSNEMNSLARRMAGLAPLNMSTVRGPNATGLTLYRKKTSKRS